MPRIERAEPPIDIGKPTAEDWDAACAFALSIVPDGLGDKDPAARRYMDLRNGYLAGLHQGRLRS